MSLIVGCFRNACRFSMLRDNYGSARDVVNDRSINCKVPLERAHAGRPAA